MPINLVECLSCGATRRFVTNRLRPVQQDECARCGYVGWAQTESLTESLRRALRDHTVDQRRHVTAW
jgi:Zn ribbon nucleic-acid-binding protein